MNRDTELVRNNIGFYHKYSLPTEIFGPMHKHSNYEIYYFVQGNCILHIEGKQYLLTPHSLLLISPFVLHGIESQKGSNVIYERYTLHFDPDVIHSNNLNLLLSSFHSLKATYEKNMYIENLESFHLTPFFDAIADCISLNENEKTTLVPIYTEALLGKIYMILKSNSPSGYQCITNPTISRVIDYIDSHVTTPIDTTYLSKKFYISKSSLNQQFYNVTGSTIKNYVTLKRCSFAQSTLKQGTSAKEVAKLAGYEEYSTFYRAYIKIHGHSPFVDQI